MRKLLYIGLLAAFGAASLSIPEIRAGEMVMPAPGTMVGLSPAYAPAYLSGIIIHPDNALQFDFLINKGDSGLTEAQKRVEYARLVKYFMASLTVPDRDQWVNLSPYEKDRIIADGFEKTGMGRDLLAQDYLLKQITSSLMYPESDLGKTFWGRVYERARKEYGRTDVPVSTFNKVWIVPDQAVIYEAGNTAYIAKSHLKVMLEEDYLALTKNAQSAGSPKGVSSISSQTIRETIIPELEKEVNEGGNFAVLRQVFSGMLLATWYKKALRGSLLGKVYADQDKANGLARAALTLTTERIYRNYLEAFKKGVYNYIKDDIDQYTHQPIPRKYFAGGIRNTYAATAEFKSVDPGTLDLAMSADRSRSDVAGVRVDPAMQGRSEVEWRTVLRGISEMGYPQAARIFASARQVPGPMAQRIRPIFIKALNDFAQEQLRRIRSDRPDADPRSILNWIKGLDSTEVFPPTIRRLKETTKQYWDRRIERVSAERAATPADLTGLIAEADGYPDELSAEQKALVEKLRGRLGQDNAMSARGLLRAAVFSSLVGTAVLAGFMGRQLRLIQEEQVQDLKALLIEREETNTGDFRKTKERETGALLRPGPQAGPTHIGFAPDFSSDEKALVLKVYGLLANMNYMPQFDKIFQETGRTLVFEKGALPVDAAGVYHVSLKGKDLTASRLPDLIVSMIRALVDAHNRILDDMKIRGERLPLRGNPEAFLLPDVWSISADLDNKGFPTIGRMLKYQGSFASALAEVMRISDKEALDRVTWQGNRMVIDLGGITKRDWDRFMRDLDARTVGFYYVNVDMASKKLILEPPFFSDRAMLNKTALARIAGGLLVAAWGAYELWQWQEYFQQVEQFVRDFRDYGIPYEMPGFVDYAGAGLTASAVVLGIAAIFYGVPQQAPRELSRAPWGADRRLAKGEYYVYESPTGLQQVRLERMELFGLLGRTLQLTFRQTDSDGDINGAKPRIINVPFRGGRVEDKDLPNVRERFDTAQLSDQAMLQVPRDMADAMFKDVLQIWDLRTKGTPEQKNALKKRLEDLGDFLKTRIFFEPHHVVSAQEHDRIAGDFAFFRRQGLFSGAESSDDFIRVVWTSFEEHHLALRNRDEDLGGIDLNSARLDLQIKRDGKGVPLPLAQQDMAQLGRISGFVPVILAIQPASKYFQRNNLSR